MDLRTEGAGRAILIAASALAAVLVIASLAYAAGTGGRNQAALGVAGCEPGLSPSGLQCTTQPMLASEYLGLLKPATQQVDADMAVYDASERHHLTAAEAALTAEAAVMKTFDSGLAGVQFPPAMTPMAQAVINADQTLASLITKQARSATLTVMRSYTNRVQAATAAVQTDMNRLLKAVNTPPQDGGGG
jgi:hypothetical protein